MASPEKIRCGYRSYGASWTGLAVIVPAAMWKGFTDFLNKSEIPGHSYFPAGANGPSEFFPDHLAMDARSIITAYLDYRDSQQDAGSTAPKASK
jgi:hypothetical protein